MHFSLHKVTSSLQSHHIKECSIYVKGIWTRFLRDLQLCNTTKEWGIHLKGISSSFQRDLQLCKVLLPIGSMYAIYGNIYHQYTPNVSIYTIHGSYGLKRYRNSWKEDRITTKWNPFFVTMKKTNYGIPWTKCWCKYVQNLLHKGVSHLIENHAIV